MRIDKGELLDEEALIMTHGSRASARSSAVRVKAAHERSLSIIESVVASGIRSFFAAQQRAILIRLGAIR